MKKISASVNPRRIPRSQADEVKLRQYADAFNYTLDSLNKGYISTRDLEVVLKDEYGTTIEMR